MHGVEMSVISQRAFAKLVGVSSCAINKAIKAGWLTAPLDEDLALAEWRERHPTAGTAVRRDFHSIAADIAEEKNWNKERTKQEALLAEERRLKLELERLELQGSLHHAADVEAVWADILVRTRTRILAVPSQAAPIISALKKNRSIADIQAVIELAIREALTEMSQYDEGKIRAAQKRRRAGK